jgi:uncharacterized protein (TIGR02453 family)
MKSGFAGFPKEAMTFFRDLKKNNTREWFRERKQIYDEKVKGPMVELMDALNREMARFAPGYLTSPEKAIYRIYRDTRFSHDKSPYKTHIAAVFTRLGMEKHASAGLYFSVSPEEIEVAGGVYMPGPDQLLKIRNHLASHHEEFRRITSGRSFRALMGKLWGEQLSRAPKGFPADHPAADLLRYKQWLVYVLLDPSLASTPRLLPELAKRFRVMTPFIEFLNRPLAGKPRPEVLTHCF